MRDQDLPELPCREFVELVTDYLEDRLSPLDRARFAALMSECIGIEPGKGARRREYLVSIIRLGAAQGGRDAS